MSTIVPADKRLRVLTAIGAALLIAGLVWAMLASARPERLADHARTRERPAAAEKTPAPTVRHAPWKIRVRWAGSPGRLSKRARTRLERQRRRVTASVRGAYDALFLSGQTPPRFFTAAARRAFRSAPAGLPRRASGVNILWRRATIGVQAPSAVRASARVSVVARGHHAGRLFKLSHRASLWLERGPSRWRIVAFEIDRHPLKPKRAA